MFVKLSDGRFIPMIEAGCNNVWEADNKRRVRHWQQANYLVPGKNFLTEDEILTGVDNFINIVKSCYVGKPKPDYEGGDGVITYTDKELENRFGYFEGVSIYGKSTHVTTAQQIRNFFKKGIERAISIDEIMLRVHWTIKWPETENNYPKTEDELFAIVEDGEKRGFDVWIDFADPWKIERIWDRKKAEAKKIRTKKEHTKGYVVTCNSRYLEKATSRYFHLSSYIEYAHVYPLRATAEKMQKRISRRYTSELIEVEKVNGKWQRTA
jgi:hypothetical protein